MNEMIVPLLAGQYYDVGEVAIWQLDDQLFVEYRLDAEYMFTPDGDGTMGASTHLHLFTDNLHFADVPTAGGTRNPQPGLFDSNQRPDLVQLLVVDERLVRYWVPLDRFVDQSTVHIAAHAMVDGLFGAHGEAVASVRTDQQTLRLDVPAANSTTAVFQAEAPVHWEVKGTNILVDIASEGFEYQGPWADVGSDCLAGLHSYLRYIVESDQIAFSQNGEFPPGSSSYSLGDDLTFVDWVGGSIDLAYEYNPANGDKRWCSFPAGEYLDTVTITVSGAEAVVSETAWSEGLRFTERGNWSMYTSFTLQSWEP